MKGRVRIAGKEYDCEVINGERFIDGKTVEDFLATLAPQIVEDMARIGKKALDDERNGTLGNPQELADALHSRRVN